MTIEEPTEGRKLLGYLLEFDNVDDLTHGAEKVRDAGYSNWDCHTPFPVHGLDHAMGAKPSHVQWIVLACGFTGLLTGLFIQWWMNAVVHQGNVVTGYQYFISGKPFWSVPANIPVMFELTILFSAFASFFGMLGVNRLPQYNHFTMYSERFGQVTDDKFFISISSEDPKFDVSKTRDMLSGLKGTYLEVLED
ncbi:DUF3341 domain-containing protein [bacterium]|nr:DUF3341 domain-containing protein [bacterium]